MISDGMFRYDICEVLGRGAFGITYLAKCQNTDNDSKEKECSSLRPSMVAIKELFLIGVNGRDGVTVTNACSNGLFYGHKAKLMREANDFKRLKHPNVVKTYGAFEENNTVYCVMDYVQGCSLEDLIRSNLWLTEEDCLKYSRQICEALEYIHSMGILHLDIKPANVMLSTKGHVVLIDFGTAMLVGRTGTIPLGLTWTSGYAPIEQYSSRPISNNGIFPATIDIYALGATMFKMLTGKCPPDAAYILNNGFPFTEFEYVSCSHACLEIVQKCMSPLMASRYQNAKALMVDLKRMQTAHDKRRNDLYYGSNIESIITGEPTIIKINVRKDTDMVDFSFVVEMPTFLPFYKFYIRIKKLSLYLKIWRTQNVKDASSTSPMQECVFDRIINYIKQMSRRSEGKEMPNLGFPVSVSPEELKITLYANGEPYATYFSGALVGRNFGDLQDNPSEIINCLKNLIPNFDVFWENTITGDNQDVKDGLPL